MAHGDSRKGKWRGNWRMQWVASTLHTTSERGVSSITTADGAHLGCQQSTELTPTGRFKWTRPFRTKDEIWFLRVCHHISNAVYLRRKKWMQTSACVHKNKQHDLCIHRLLSQWSSQEERDGRDMLHARRGVYTGCFMTCGRYCRRWFPRSLWSKKVHKNMCPIFYIFYFIFIFLYFFATSFKSDGLSALGRPTKPHQWGIMCSQYHPPPYGETQSK